MQFFNILKPKKILKKVNKNLEITKTNIGGMIMDNCNCRVKCTVCECTHNDMCQHCNLNSIEISGEKTTTDAIATPHYCKSFCRR